MRAILKSAFHGGDDGGRDDRGERDKPHRHGLEQRPEPEFGARSPALVIFQTDGSPDSRRAAEQTLCRAARLPLFWQFVGYGKDRFDFLRKLDELAVPARRVVDNAGFFPAGKDPKLIPDAVLYDRLTGKFPDWLRAATAAGIVT